MFVLFYSLVTSAVVESKRSFMLFFGFPCVFLVEQKSVFSPVAYFFPISVTVVDLYFFFANSTTFFTSVFVK